MKQPIFTENRWFALLFLTFSWVSLIVVMEGVKHDQPFFVTLIIALVLSALSWEALDVIAWHVIQRQKLHRLLREDISTPKGGQENGTPPATPVPSTLLPTAPSAMPSSTPPISVHTNCYLVIPPNKAPEIIRGMPLTNESLVEPSIDYPPALNHPAYADTGLYQAPQINGRPS